MKFIIVIIPKFDYYTILFENDFIDNNEFRTQNQIIELLKILGFEREEFICDLCYRSI